jgi:hypothetical protein
VPLTSAELDAAVAQSRGSPLTLAVPNVVTAEEASAADVRVFRGTDDVERRLLAPGADVVLAPVAQLGFRAFAAQDEVVGAQHQRSGGGAAGDRLGRQQHQTDRHEAESGGDGGGGPRSWSDELYLCHVCVLLRYNESARAYEVVRQDDADLRRHRAELVAQRRLMRAVEQNSRAAVGRRPTPPVATASPRARKAAREEPYEDFSGARVATSPGDSSSDAADGERGSLDGAADSGDSTAEPTADGSAADAEADARALAAEALRVGATDARPLPAACHFPFTAQTYCEVRFADAASQAMDARAAEKLARAHMQQRGDGGGDGGVRHDHHARHQRVPQLLSHLPRVVFEVRLWNDPQTQLELLADGDPHTFRDRLASLLHASRATASTPAQWALWSAVLAALLGGWALCAAELHGRRLQRDAFVDMALRRRMSAATASTPTGVATGDGAALFAARKRS